MPDWPQGSKAFDPSSASGPSTGMSKTNKLMFFVAAFAGNLFQKLCLQLKIPRNHVSHSPLQTECGHQVRFDWGLPAGEPTNEQGRIEGKSEGRQMVTLIRRKKGWMKAAAGTFVRSHGNERIWGRKRGRIRSYLEEVCLCYIMFHLLQSYIVCQRIGP